MIKILEKDNFVQDCVISSSDYPILQMIRKISPKMPLGLVISDTIINVERLELDFYSLRVNLVTKDFIQSAHADNRKVHGWTVNDRYKMERLINLDIDNLITDQPSIAKNLK